MANNTTPSVVLQVLEIVFFGNKNQNREFEGQAAYVMVLQFVYFS